MSDTRVRNFSRSFCLTNAFSFITKCNAYIASRSMVFCFVFFFQTLSTILFKIWSNKNRIKYNLNDCEFTTAMTSNDYHTIRCLGDNVECTLHLTYIHTRLTQPAKCLKIKARLMAQTYIKSCTQMIHNKS